MITMVRITDSHIQPCAVALALTEQLTPANERHNGSEKWYQSRKREMNSTTAAPAATLSSIGRLFGSILYGPGDALPPAVVPGPAPAVAPGKVWVGTGSAAGGGAAAAAAVASSAGPV